MNNINNQIAKELQELADGEYRLFSIKLNPNVPSILGVKVPLLRDLAKKISHDDWRSYLEHAQCEYLEERMLYGLVIGYVTGITLEERLQLIARFVPLINCWAVCDTACSTYNKYAKKNPEQFYDFIQPYLQSDKEYFIRFGVVLLMDSFINEEYLQRLFTHFSNIHHTGYYVQMAVAWAVSVCYVKFPKETYSFLQQHTLDAFTHNKALQKAVESFRVDTEEKERIKQLKVPSASK